MTESSGVFRFVLLVFLFLLTVCDSNVFIRIGRSLWCFRRVFKKDPGFDPFRGFFCYSL